MKRHTHDSILYEVVNRLILEKPHEERKYEELLLQDTFTLSQVQTLLIEAHYMGLQEMRENLK
jgi:hypothetical protein